MKRTSIFLLAALLGTGCLDIAEERARTDEQVGHAAAEGNRLDITDGLGAVRRFEPGFVEIWGNAPSLRIELEVGAPAPSQWLLVLRNVVPDAVIRATTSDGIDVPITLEPSSIGTERRALLALAPQSRVTIDVAAPDADARAPFDFIDFADVQRAIDEVEDVFDKMNEQSSARFVVMAGDITQTGAREALELFQEKQRGLALPIFTTLGNHELGSGTPLYHSYFGRGSESFTFHGARFTLLDSASATIDPTVYGWLDHWLELGRNDVHLTFMHIPPLDPIGFRDGAFSSRPEADKLIVRLARGGVDASFYGHIHSYYAFETGGIPAFISGGGGAIPERFDGIGRHFLLVSVDPDAQRVSSQVIRVD